MALCTQADIEIRLQRDLTADAPAISGTVAGLIADAQAHIETEVGRTLESASRNETLDGGDRALLLKFWPVTAVATVTEDGSGLTVDDDYKFYEDGKLIRVSGGYQSVWRTSKPKSIVVAYTGGYVSPDHDAELEHLGSICAEIAARAIRKGADAAALPSGAAGAIQSVNIEGSDSVTYATGGGTATLAGGLKQFIYLEEDEQRQLERYKSSPFE